MHRTALLIGLSGCFLLPGSSHGLKGGEVLYIAEDSEVLQVMGDTTRREDHREHSRAQPLSVIAAGARVRVAHDDQAQREMATHGAPLAGRNPWILVEVVESPVAAQRGWKGWVHVETTRRERVVAPPTSTAELPRASVLCPDADAHEEACTLTVPARTAVRARLCGAARGCRDLHGAHGFVNARQVPACPGGHS